MEYRLLSGEENNNSVFNLKIKNREGDVRETPSRAFKRVNSQSDRQYFTEVMMPVKSEELKGRTGYPNFDKTIEAKLKKKEIKGNINIISFYGDKNTEINNLVNFEDLGLLSSFETLFNDHLIAMPFPPPMRPFLGGTACVAPIISNPRKESINSFARAFGLLSFVRGLLTFEA